ncbi:MAG: hypothetical protein J5845_03105 [Lachnospiraceae bacterium]|nr:hypothetical protein [Lachnospiraceae bacterium]
MIIFLGIRAKITEIYQKYDFIVKTALKFVLMFLALKKAAGIIGYNATLSGTGAVIAFSLVGAFLPASLMVFMAVMYVFLQLLTASVLIAVTVMLVFLILYLFLLRFTPKEGVVVIATPLLISMGYPYAVPLFLGMFGSILSVVPAACGVVAYFMIKAVTNNIVTIEQLKALKDQALSIYIDILDDLLNNPPMYVMMFVFAVVIIIVVLVRMIRMDYAFEISLLVGTAAMVLAFLIGSVIAGTEVEVMPLIMRSLICMGITYVCMFFWRTLDYAGAEHVQFEDERYYYYVTAVPKITPESPKRTVRKPKPQKEEPLPEDEEEAEAIEAMESMLSGNKRPYAKPLTPGLAKRLRRDVAPRKEDSEDEDEEDELVIKGPRKLAKPAESIAEAVRRSFGRIKSVLPGRKDKTEIKEEVDEDEADSVYYGRNGKKESVYFGRDRKVDTDSVEAEDAPGDDSEELPERENDDYE